MAKQNIFLKIQQSKNIHICFNFLKVSPPAAATIDFFIKKREGFAPPRPLRTGVLKEGGWGSVVQTQTAH